MGAGGAREALRHRWPPFDSRPSFLLRAALIQILFSIRSERQLGLRTDGVGCNRVHQEPRPAFEYEYCSQISWRDPIGQGNDALLSDEHFPVGGTLIEAWASMKSFEKATATNEPPAGEVGSGEKGPKKPAKAATPRWISMAGSARTKRMRLLPISTPASAARANAKKPSFAIWAMP